MNNRTINFILFVVLMVCMGVLYTFYDYNKNLESQIIARDKTIKEIRKTDSLLIEKTKEYAKQIEKFNSQPSYILEGKEITTKEIVELLNDSYEKISFLEQENYNLKYKDSINRINSKSANYNINLLKKSRKNTIEIAQKYVDSTYITLSKLKYIKERYGIDLKHKIIDSTRTLKIINPMLKVDSALILFPYYKNRLSFKEGKWNIEIDPEFEKLRKKEIERQKRKKERNRKKN